jgi:hypothetical protein
MDVRRAGVRSGEGAVTLRRIGIALLFCAATTASSQAGEQSDRVVTAFAKVCLAKPDSMSALNKLAMAQGFALDQSGAAALANAENDKADPFNLLLFWRRGTDKQRMRLTGLIDGKIDRYELGCIVDGYGVPPQDVLAGLKTILGEPTGHTQENKRNEFVWAGGDASHGTVTLAYYDGRPEQRVGLTLARVIGAAAAKP